MRVRSSLGLILASALLLVPTSAANASGKGGLVTPDLGIKRAESSTYIGIGVNTPDGSGQTATRTVRRGHTGSFDVKLVNPGSGPNSATLKGCRPAKGFLVKYFVGSTNVSKSMKAGTLNETLGGGSSIVLRLEVTAGAKTHVGRVESCPVNVLQSDTIVDTVIGQATVRS